MSKVGSSIHQELDALSKSGGLSIAKTLPKGKKSKKKPENLKMRDRERLKFGLAWFHQNGSINNMEKTMAGRSVFTILEQT